MMVFDGDCGFCHRAVQFILAHERREDLLFVPRDSKLGTSLRKQYGLEVVESLLWIEGGRAYVEWEAVSHTAKYVGGVYGRMAAMAEVLPGAVLRAGYRLIAKVRKRLAGRPAQCLLLTPTQQQRFLE